MKNTFLLLTETTLTKRAVCMSTSCDRVVNWQHVQGVFGYTIVLLTCPLECLRESISHPTYRDGTCCFMVDL